MGRRRPEGGMGAGGGRAGEVANDFNSQNVANTLWAYGRMGRTPPERVMGAVERRAV